MTNHIHGHCGAKPSATYNTWLDMKKRCIRKWHHDYKWYGGRGIKVCDRWLNDFSAFLADMGEKPAGLTLDRINNDGNYEPGNCRWATRAEQAANKRRGGGMGPGVKVIEFAGEAMSVGDWDKKLGLKQGGIWHRLNNGWPLERALTTPSKFLARTQS